MVKQALTLAERQARWRAKHMETDDAGKERLQLVVDTGTKARLQRIAKHHGHASITSLVETWAKEAAAEIKPKRTRKKLQE